MGILNTLAPWRRTPLEDDEWERETVPDTEIDDPSYMRLERRIALLQQGEVEVDNESPGVSAVHWAPIRVRPTSAPPNAPGWWAVRSLNGRDQRWSIVEVLPDERGRLMFAFGPHEPVKWTRAPFYEWGDKPYHLPL